MLGKGRCWDLLRPEHFYPFNIPLLLPSRLDHPDAALNTDGQEGLTRSTSGLDLSAALVTDTQRFFTDSDERGLKEYLTMVNTRLPVPLPMPYLLALRERATIYQKWPQHIANARLTPEQRQIFGTLVDQRFRQWLSESGNLRQLQLLELSTGHASNAQICNANGTQTDTGGVPPKANAIPPATVGPDRGHTSVPRSSSQGRRAERTRGIITSDGQLVNGSCL
ncbi:unnamed protein product [Echinostoma caproni]|uniref:Uncharacterized protein n=1 Tax=Echinostoma caproni TaxID=27848 RepID=A0A3P8FGS2_9TREM|nr:unnamed protein product [Echinostoma caproni]